MIWDPYMYGTEAGERIDFLIPTDASGRTSFGTVVQWWGGDFPFFL